MSLQRLKAAALAFGGSKAKMGSDQRRAEVNELRLAAYAYAAEPTAATDCQACMNDAALGYRSPLPFCAVCGAPRNIKEVPDGR